MTGAERPPPEPLLLSEASPVALGGEISGDALEASFVFLGLGHPCRTFEGVNSGYALGASSAWIVGFGASQPYFRGVFQDTLCERFRGLPVFSGTSSGKTQPYWG